MSDLSEWIWMVMTARCGANVGTGELEVEATRGKSRDGITSRHTSGRLVASATKTAIKTKQVRSSKLNEPSFCIIFSLHLCRIVSIFSKYRKWSLIVDATMLVLLSPLLLAMASKPLPERRRCHLGSGTPLGSFTKGPFQILRHFYSDRIIHTRDFRYHSFLILITLPKIARIKR
jgi:hypothetical protein